MDNFKNTFKTVITEDSKQPIVSFDFDNTIGMNYYDYDENDYVRDDNDDILILPSKEIILKMHDYSSAGYKVIIVTSRLQRWRQEVIDYIKKWGLPVEPNDVHCTNGEYKAKTLVDLGVSIHYDDDIYELGEIEKTKVKGIQVRGNHEKA